jgi:NAD(P)-dependent dehydrogenase (short-subunit alcohol dehydrogenase family)
VDTTTPGLPEPPPEGATALPPGTFEGTVVLVTGGGTGLGRATATEFARLGADLVIASRKDEHLEAGRAALEPLGTRVLAGGLRHPRPRADRGRLRRRRGRAGPARRAGQQRRGQLPGAGGGHEPERVAHRRGHHAQRHVLLRPRVRPAAPGRGHAGSIVNIGASYAWTGGPGFAHSAAAKAGVKNMVETLAVEWGPYGIQVNGLVPGLFPHEDMTADIRGNLDRTHEKDRCQPALRVGRLRELGWAATFLASPYARFISGHTLVVDGANWQRRSLTNPEVQHRPGPDGQGPVRALTPDPDELARESRYRRGRSRARTGVLGSGGGLGGDGAEVDALAGALEAALVVAADGHVVVAGLGPQRAHGALLLRRWANGSNEYHRMAFSWVILASSSSGTSWATAWSSSGASGHDESLWG